MKIKGIVFILFAACVGHIGAMDPDESAEDPMLKLVTEQLPAEIGELIFAKKIDQILKAPFPKEELLNFAQNYLSLITQFPMKTKKRYLNEFAKKWYLNYGKELELSAWIKKHFPGQTPEQVLYYGFSIQDYLTSPALQNKMPLVRTVREETRLDLSNMKINDLQGLQKIPNISNLSLLGLARNQLTTIPPNAFAGLTSLETLALWGNQLTTIQPNAFAGLPNLEYLRLQQNQLTTIQPNAFAGLTRLYMLRLARNQLTTIPPKAFAGLTRLTYLFLDRNQLTTIPTDAFAGLPSLYELRLEDNQLSTIPTAALAGLTNLRELSLGNNQLSTIPTDALAGLPKLRELRLGNNKLDEKTKKAIKKALPGVKIDF